ncbi:MAG: hypothetical protein NTZ52_02045 [Chlamydiae bacterium]|nr:hypothetical protein [Chlamydiota bacterium]
MTQNIMTPPNPVAPVSTALVPYDPTLPHISIKAHLEAAADKAVSHAFEVAKFESQHLSLEGRLIYLAQNLPKMLPFPFSGVIALQAGKAIEIVYKKLPQILGVAPARVLTGDQKHSAVPFQNSGNCALYNLYAACYQIDRDSTETLWYMMRCKEMALIIDDPGIPKKDPISSATYEKICQFMKEEKARIPKDLLQKLSRCLLHLSASTP